jgi:hypothetical protein
LDLSDFLIGGTGNGVDAAIETATLRRCRRPGREEQIAFLFGAKSVPRPKA